MPLKWNCGSTVFALDLDPSGAQIVTRLTPEGFWLEPVFLPQHFTLMSKINNQHLKLTDGSLESGWTAGPGHVKRQCFIRIQTEPHGGIERFAFPQPAFWTPNHTAWSICETDPLRLLLRGFQIIFYILLGGLMPHSVLGSRFGPFSHPDTQTKVKTTVNVVEIWICLKTLLKMLFYSPLLKSGQPLEPRSSTYQGSAPTGSSKTNVLSLQS